MHGPPGVVASSGSQMSEHAGRFPEFFVTQPSPCPYLPGRVERKLFTHLTIDKPHDIVDRLLTNGFRRSQSVAYMPYCESCQACVSVRVRVDDFVPGRTMRRITQRNADLQTRRLRATPSAEQYRLFRRYIDQRHADGGMADMTWLDYEAMIADSTIETSVVEYHRSGLGNGAGSLMAVSLRDRLSDGLSLVYSVYDPDAAERSLGTHVIIEAIAEARALRLPYVYLGYWVQRSEKMAYKARFQPQEILTGEGWVPVAQVGAVASSPAPSPTRRPATRTVSAAPVSASRAIV
jgi:leucyl-tRNA---protein transferase